MWRGATISLMLATSLRAAPATTQSTTTRATTQPAISISGVITALLQESESTSPRTKPDYFTAHPPAPAAEAIVPVLSQSLAQNPTHDAYVKWQLLGVLPEKVEGELTEQLLDAYRAAPQFHIRPGVDLRAKQQLDHAVQRAKKDQTVELQESFSAELERVAAANGPVLAYRADLYRRLPISYDSVALGLEDSKQRCAAGIDPKPFIKQVTADLQSWAAVDATPQQLTATSRLLTSLSQTKPTEYYDALEWSSTGGSGRLRWKKKKLYFNDRKQLDEVNEFVRQQLRGSADLKNEPKEVKK